MKTHLTYSGKLLLVEWQKKRLEILSRDNWQCVRCGELEGVFHVHHKTYEKGKDPWDYPNENFESLCGECHRKEHSKIHFDGHGNNVTQRHINDCLPSIVSLNTEINEKMGLLQSGDESVMPRIKLLINKRNLLRKNHA